MMPRPLAWALGSCLLLLVCLYPAQAATVQARSASSEAAFALGTMDGTALDEEGRIRLAPAMETIWGPEEGIVWALQPAGGESVFVALSGPGRLLRVGTDREPEQLFRAQDDGLITALAADGEGGVIVGLSPEGEILQIDGRGANKRLAQTEATFILSLIHI